MNTFYKGLVIVVLCAFLCGCHNQIAEIEKQTRLPLKGNLSPLKAEMAESYHVFVDEQLIRKENIYLFKFKNDEAYSTIVAAARTYGYYELPSYSVPFVVGGKGGDGLYMQEYKALSDTDYYFYQVYIDTVNGRLTFHEFWYKPEQ